jgi:hypothetical protein
VAPRLEVQRLGYFGSYANGTWGVGSDIDLVAIVSASDEPFERRSVKWPTERLPVPADLLVYTEPEWTAILKGTTGSPGCSAPGWCGCSIGSDRPGADRQPAASAADATRPGGMHPRPNDTGVSTTGCRAVTRRLGANGGSAYR